MENMVALEYPDDLAFCKAHHTDCALFIRLAHFHFLYLIYLNSEAIYCFLDVVLIHSELNRVL